MQVMSKMVEVHCQDRLTNHAFDISTRSSVIVRRSLLNVKLPISFKCETSATLQIVCIVEYHNEFITCSLCNKGNLT